MPKSKYPQYDVVIGDRTYRLNVGLAQARILKKQLKRAGKDAWIAKVCASKVVGSLLTEHEVR